MCYCKYSNSLKKKEEKKVRRKLNENCLELYKISNETHQVGRTHIEPYMTNGRLLLFSFLIVWAAITTAVYSIIYDIL